jgi:hypothetical protein
MVDAMGTEVKMLSSRKMTIQGARCRMSHKVYNYNSTNYQVQEWSQREAPAILQPPREQV